MTDSTDPGGPNMPGFEAKMGPINSAKRSIFGTHENEGEDAQGGGEPKVGTHENEGEDAQGGGEPKVGTHENEGEDAQGGGEPKVGPEENEGEESQGGDKAKVGPEEENEDEVEEVEKPKVGTHKNKGKESQGDDKAKIGPSGQFVHHDVPQPFPIDAGDVDDGPEYKPLALLLKKMTWQFDRTLGFKAYETFCDEALAQYRSGMKDSRQSFARTFTPARKKPATILELELARTSHGGYLPKTAIKHAFGPMNKWANPSKAAYQVIDDRVQPIPPPKPTFAEARAEVFGRTSGSKAGPSKSKKGSKEKGDEDQSGDSDSETEHNKHPVQAAKASTKNQSRAPKRQTKAQFLAKSAAARAKAPSSKSKVGSQKKKNSGVANAGCGQEAKKIKKRKKDDDEDGEDEVPRKLRIRETAPVVVDDKV